MAALFQAAAEPTRAHILLMLGGGERTVDEIGMEVGLSMSATSRHTTRLRHIGLVDFRQDGNRRVYSLTEAGKAMRRTIETLAG
jgi:DNA-binding transcriptional ArsR family regulator